MRAVSLLLLVLPSLVTCQQGLVFPDGRKRIFTIAISHDYGAQEYIDPQGYLRGFIHDLIDAVCGEAGIDCRTVWDDTSHCWTSEAGQHPYGGRGLHGRWFDGCSGYDTTRQRTHTFQFSRPYTKVLKSYFYYKKGTNFDERDLGGLTKPIGFVAGWASDETCVANQDKQIKNSVLQGDNIRHYTGPTALLAAVRNGEIQAAFADEFTFSPGDVSNYLSYQSARPYVCILAGNGIMTRKDNDFVTYWNLGFQKLINTGKYRKLCEEGADKHGHKGDILCLDT